MKTERVTENVRGFDSESVVQTVPGKTVPELWIGRQSSIHNDDYRDEWHTYSDKLGRVNRGLGFAASRGSMAVTYVSATEMGRMIQEKYPRICDDRKKMSSIVKRIAKDINGYIRYQSRATVFEESDLLTRSRQIIEQDRLTDNDLDNPELSERYYSYLDDDSKKQLGEFDGRMWGVADMAIGEIGIYGRDGLGFHINDHVIEQERQDLIGYLQKDKFNIRKIDRERKPHIVTFHSFAPIPHTGLQVPADTPLKITLDEPKAITNHI